ncbi:MAG: InlB B-repeat-containing protein [Methanobacteriaceae archaeon]|nr:InlB B-repeat-containing protein [Candidatus Methanorudis spinitermitis]
MNSSKRIFTLLILMLSVLVFSMITVTAVTVSEQQTNTNHDDIQIEVKYKKVSTNKIIFNGNGGKIGTKNTVSININKGSKIKKFPTTPKRTSYTFKGWYTKKSGGAKISVNTKPTKSATVYAQWKKKGNSRILNAEEKKLVGLWEARGFSSVHLIGFNKDGTFVCSKNGSTSSTRYVLQIYGNYQAKNGKIYLTNAKGAYKDTYSSSEVLYIKKSDYEVYGSGGKESGGYE